MNNTHKDVNSDNGLLVVMLGPIGFFAVLYLITVACNGWNWLLN